MAIRKIAAALVLLGATTFAAPAQDYPNKSITMINPFAAGGGADVLLRPFASKLSEVLGQTVIVENKPGAGQSVGAALVARAAPDGYTLLANAIPTHVNVAAVIPDLPYDPVKSFAPVSQIAGGGSQLVLVKPSLNVNTFQELIALIKAKPGEITYGSQGPGSLQHVIGELLRAEANINWVHVPYRGGAPALQGILGGHIDVLLTDASAMASVQAGQVKLLAVTSEKRIERMPNTPTLAELGYPNATTEIGFALFAPAGTPKPIVDKLNEASRKVTNDLSIVQIIRNLNFVPVASSPEDMQARVARFAVQYLPIIKRLDLKAN